MKSSRTKTVFWMSTSLLGVIFTVLVTLAMEFLGHILGHSGWGRHGGAAAFPCLLLSLMAVTALYRRLGLMEGERIVETLRRNLENGPVLLDAPVEIRTLRALWLVMALTMDVFAVSIFILVRILPAVPGTEWAGYATAAFFAVFSLGVWYGYATGAGLTARVDRTEVRGDGAGPRSRVRWNEIASCEITKVPMPLGDLTLYSFQDNTGRPLMRLTLPSNGDNQERFKEAVRECFR